MGRREAPLDPEGGPLTGFAFDLRELRRTAGSPSYQELARLTHYAASTLAAAAAGRKAPSRAVLAAYVDACGGDVEAWERRRLALAAEVRTDEGSGAVPDDPVAGPGSDPGSGSGAEPEAEAGPVPVAGPVGTARPAGGRRVSGLLRRLGSLGAAAVLLLTCAASQSPDADTTDHRRWLRLGTDVPERYRGLIVRAGTLCAAPQVSPALVAAILKAESGFDPHLHDPARDEYGIARWTPRVLRYYLPEDEQRRVPVPPFDERTSILALGRMLCTLAPQLEGVAGDPVMNLAAAYRTASWVVQQQNGVPDRLRPYTDVVRGHLLAYAPERGACLPYAAGASSYPRACAPFAH
ncbi:helix-turn-helix domain-containing protein [Kitasatospora sp. NPDC051853]|uniref:helix-turn-helix domain-containing protein n=1 Tax=Kitasatospora sp. NPDC051853 TaxID=3364058 RepID=UPI00378C6504